MNSLWIIAIGGTLGLIGAAIGIYDTVQASKDAAAEATRGMEIAKQTNETSLENLC